MNDLTRLTPKVLDALRRQNEVDGRAGRRANIGVDDLALLIEAAERLVYSVIPPAVTEREAGR